MLTRNRKLLPPKVQKGKLFLVCFGTRETFTLYAPESLKPIEKQGISNIDIVLITVIRVVAVTSSTNKDGKERSPHLLKLKLLYYRSFQYPI